MPAHEESIVGREDAAIVHFPRRLQQGRPGSLQNHRPLLREAVVSSRRFGPPGRSRSMKVSAQA